jgi:hypothetical protein
MIRIKPEPENTFSCPKCGATNPTINDIIIPSIHVVADCTCRQCGLEFYQSLPLGHSVAFPVSISKKEEDAVVRSLPNLYWHLDTLEKNTRKVIDRKVEIRKIVYRECDNVVILNTLDYLYGHVLLKLYNALFHIDNHKDTGLILIIPRMFEWLIPKGCAEAWIVDLKLGELSYGYTSLQEFVSAEMKRFKNVFLSKAYPTPDFSKVQIERFTGIQPFNLENFSKIKPTITFIAREDRWWFGSPIAKFFYRVCRRLNILGFGSRVLTHHQNRLIKKTIKGLKKEFLPDAVFYVTGLGRTGSFDGYAIDKRQTRIDTEIEKEWCRIYAGSHVVMGIHGSNMLLPTAHAAGCVEVLPYDRQGNFAEDLSIRYNDRRQIFFYRFVDSYAPVSSVKEKINVIIKCYVDYNRQMCVDIYS